MQLAFESTFEASAGERWKALFDSHWPAYKKWFQSEGDEARSSYLASLRKLKEFVPEILPTYETLCGLAGNGDVAARFLSMYRPPAYLTGCSQAVWPGDEPMLVRNYDYSPRLCEGSFLYTAWNGRKVMAMGDCLWGVLDGMNDAGLVVSLTFGGRRIVGDGFGVPLILRYLLEFCETTKEATAVLARVPTHMAYNVTVLDKSGSFRTVFLSPDRAAIVRQLPVVTNHQGRIEWHSHARATASVEREKFLFFRLADTEETADGLVDAFMHSPLFSTNYRLGFGTLYTAIYWPLRGKVELRWQSGSCVQSFNDFSEGVRTISYGTRRRAPVGSF